MASFISCAKPFAVSVSSLKSSSSARFAEPILPAAFIRGETVNATDVALTYLSPAPATSSSSFMPARERLFMLRSPALTIVRFSPVSSTTSLIVPIAARSAKSSITAVSSSSSMAHASLNATPAPQSCLNGLEQSARWRSTIASARGRTSGTLWWSVITTSMPSSYARSVASAALTPLSTVTIS